MKLTEQRKFKLLFNLDISSCSLQVHAQGGNCSEAQHSSAPTLHPGPQREDLPVLGDERRLPHGVAARGEGPAAPTSPQPLPGEEEGNHQETPLLHRCDYECTAALRGRKSKQEIVASHQFRRVLSCYCCSQEAAGSRPLLSVFAPLRSTHSKHTIAICFQVPFPLLSVPCGLPQPRCLPALHLCIDCFV